MKQQVKRLFLVLSVFFIVILGGCNSNQEKENEQAKKEQETTEIKMVANDLYVEPLNPTQAQIKAYNALSEAVESGDKKEEATMVAVNFAFDFFMLSNKEDAEDYGGMQYIPTDKISSFMEFAHSYYYGNYPTIVNEYGKENLPEIIDLHAVLIKADFFHKKIRLHFTLKNVYEGIKPGNSINEHESMILNNNDKPFIKECLRKEAEAIKEIFNEWQE